MNCDDAKHVLAEALGHELNVADRAAFDQHLAACDDCRLELASLTKTLDALGRLEAVPSYPPVPQQSSPRRAAPQLRRFVVALRYAAAVALAFAAGFAVRGSMSGNTDTAGTRPQNAPVVQPANDRQLTTRAALAFAHQRNPRANQLAKLMMALSSSVDD